jgi:NAD(P)-dependent dehydrogenase (short-subunit alcohol dehydrogenase family)
MSTVQGKIVLITGAAGGFGSALAAAFAGQGARMALLDIDRERLDELAARLRQAGAEVSCAVADLRTPDGVRAGIRAGLAPYDNQLDVLVSNVGVLVSGRFEEISDEQLDAAFAINFFTHCWAARAVLPLMRGRPGANIVFMGSDQGSQPDASLYPYAPAKAALHSLTKLLAREVGPHIRVNAVAPGMARTPLVMVLMERLAREEFHTDVQDAERLELQRRQVPMGRLCEPEEVAQAVLYLSNAGFATGVILDLSGGNVRGGL